jgi:hypothetical protein
MTTVAFEMAVIRLPYVNVYTDRHGNVRRYFRKRGHKPVPLPGIPGSAEFMAAYQEALGGPAPKTARQGPGSVGALIFDYLQSPAFTNLCITEGLSDSVGPLWHIIRSPYGP